MKVRVLSDCRAGGKNVKAGDILDLDYGQDANGQAIGKDWQLAGELNHAGRIVELDNPKAPEPPKSDKK